MKKYASIFELFTRNTFYKIMLIITAMAGAQLFWFCQKLMEWVPGEVLELEMMPVEDYSLEWVVDRSNSYGWFCIG